MTEIDTSKASREFDEWLAEHVMGWTYCPPNVRGIGWKTHDNRFVGDVPRYTTDIAAAWEVVEAMEKRGWYLGLRQHIGEWEAWYTRAINHPRFNVDQFGTFAQTVPLAICQAAYAALSSRD